ncbi:MAG: hypothetical protein MJH10_16015 [Epibacterium sp.]|nr:hypothetical protein [Epibacterium sp.]NQX75020.1 hypothetical protein [Epibacterium sp.]
MSPLLPLTTTIPLATAARRYRAIADTQRLTPVELLSGQTRLLLTPLLLTQKMFAGSARISM